MEIEKLIKSKEIIVDNTKIKLSELKNYDLGIKYGYGTIETKEFEGKLEIYIETTDNKTAKEIVLKITDIIYYYK